MHQAPVAYAQSYRAMGSTAGWWANETDPGVHGIDLSLADASTLGQGLGIKVLDARA